MATYLARSGLGTPAHNERPYDTILDANRTLIDSLATAFDLFVRSKETPSSTLNVSVSSGSFRKSDGTIVDYAGTATQLLSASSTSYIYLTDAGTLTVSMVSFPATAHVRLAIVTTSGS